MQDCPEEPTHGYDGEAATFCEAHMAVGMKVKCNTKYRTVAVVMLEMIMGNAQEDGVHVIRMMV